MKLFRRSIVRTLKVDNVANSLQKQFRDSEIEKLYRGNGIFDDFERSE